MDLTTEAVTWRPSDSRAAAHLHAFDGGDNTDDHAMNGALIMPVASVE